MLGGGRDDGTKVPFLSAKTLHIVDYALWMLPFNTKTDLNMAATKVHVSHEARNSFMRMLQAEHSLEGARDQLRELWRDWVTKNYGTAPEETGTRNVAFGAAPTPPDSPGKQ